MDCGLPFIGYFVIPIPYVTYKSNCAQHFGWSNKKCFWCRIGKYDVSYESLGFGNASTFFFFFFFHMDLKGEKNHNILVLMVDSSFKGMH